MTDDRRERWEKEMHAWIATLEPGSSLSIALAYFAGREAAEKEKPPSVAYEAGLIKRAQGYAEEVIRLNEKVRELQDQLDKSWDTPGGKRIYLALEKIQELQKIIAKKNKALKKALSRWSHSLSIKDERAYRDCEKDLALAQEER